MKRILAILLIVCSLLALLVPAASAAEDTLTELQRAVVETALAYYYKGDTIQYDSYALSGGAWEKSAIPRQTNNRQPEDATADDSLFTVCSAFVHDIYYAAFGMHILDAARWEATPTLKDQGSIYNLMAGSGLSDEALAYDLAIASTTDNLALMGVDSDDALGGVFLGYWGSETGTTPTDIDINTVQNQLKPGDLIVVRHAKKEGGHALMFLGDIFGDDKDYVIHATGSKFNSTNGDYVEASGSWTDKEFFNRGGAVCVTPFDTAFESGGDYYLRNEKSVTLLRPLAAVENENLTMTNAAKFRLDRPALRVDKTADVKPYRDVKVGDTITYTIKVENNTIDTENKNNLGDVEYYVWGSVKKSGYGAVVEDSRDKKYIDLVLTETLPAGTTLYSADGSYTQNGSTLTWNVPSISAGESTEISYTVQVTGGSQVVSPEGKLSATGAEGFVQTKELTHQVVSQQVDAAAIGNITTVDPVATDRSGIDVVEDVYRALGYDVKLPGAQKLVNTIFTEKQFPTELQKVNQVKFQLADPEDLASQDAKTLRNMVVPGFVGGTRLFTADENGVRTNENRLRMLNHEFLQPGDVLIYIQTAEALSTAVISEEAYVYLGNNKFARYVDGEYTVVTDSVTTSGNYKNSEILYKAFPKRLFVALRPSRVGLALSGAVHVQGNGVAKGYDSLEEACTEAVNGDIITLKESVTATENVTISAGVTLDASEAGLTLDSGVTMTVAGSVTGSVTAEPEQVVLEGEGNYLGITIPEGVTGTVHPDASLDGEYTMNAGSVIKITGTVDTTRENVQLMNLTDGGTVTVTNGAFSLGNRVAKQMGDTTEVVLIAQSGNETYVGKTVALCVQSTVEELLKNIVWTEEGQAKTGRALAAMLHYGAAAQTYFGYSVGALANAKIGEYDDYLKNFDLTHTDNSALSGQDTSLIYGTSCILGEELQMKMYFRVPVGTSGITVEISYGDVNSTLTVSDMTKAESTDTDCEYYSYVLPDLALTDLDEQVTVTVKQDGVAKATATETLRSYLARLYAQGDKHTPMANAILQYALAVDALS